MTASIIWGLLVLISTEVFSLFHWINFTSISAFWILLTIALIIIQQTDLREDLKPLQHDLTHLEISILTGVGFILTMIGFIAIMAPPNNWDSMTTHMSRVSHWIQNRSVDVYPSSMLKQLNYPPWSAYTLLHFQILINGDRFANLIQWFSMFGSLVGLTAIARDLGGQKQAQILTCVTAATIPMGILQASSTQNDYVVTFWLICFIFFGMRLKTMLKASDALFAGAGLGLAFLIKGTAYLYALPFLLWITVVCIKKAGLKDLKPVLVLLAAALSVNACYFARNYSLTRTLVPPSESTHVVNQIHTPQAVLSNAARNAGMHLGTPSELLNSWVERGLRLFHKGLGLKYNDARTTFGEYELTINEPSFHEDHATNLLHILLMAACIGIYFISKYQRKERKLTIYLLSVLGGFFIFVYTVKWAPWHSRYHLPIFILSAPFIGIVLSRIPKQRPVTIIAVILILCSMPWVWSNKSRSFFKKRNIFNSSRMDQYFYNKKPYQELYTSAVTDVISSGCSEVGLSLSGDSWEYPFWTLFKEHSPSSRVRIEHVNVDNISSLKPYPLGRFSPCAIIDDDAQNKIELYVDGLRFERKTLHNFIGVFEVK